MPSRLVGMLASAIAAVSALYTVLVVLATDNALTLTSVLRPFASTFLFITLLGGLWYLMSATRQRHPVVVYAVNGIVVGAYAAVAPVLSGLSSSAELSASRVAVHIAMFVVIGAAVGFTFRNRPGTRRPSSTSR